MKAACEGHARRPLMQSKCIILSLTKVKKSHPRRSDSTAVRWGVNRLQRDRGCADSGLHHRCKRTTGSHQRGGRSVGCVCMSVVQTHSLMEELEKQLAEKDKMETSMLYVFLLILRPLPGHLGQQSPGCKCGFEHNS